MNGKKLVSRAGSQILWWKFFGVKADADQIAAAHIPVAVLLLVITFVPFFAQLPILSLERQTSDDFH